MSALAQPSQNLSGSITAHTPEPIADSTAAIIDDYVGVVGHQNVADKLGYFSRVSLSTSTKSSQARSLRKTGMHYR